MVKTQFKRGDLVKRTDMENKVFRIYGFAYDHHILPDGWLLDGEGCIHNPDKCEKYIGATSCFVNH